jgi:hypothetical protein
VRRYVEVSTNGIDESLQGISNSPFGALPTAVGLRVPSLVPANGARYLFLLASRVVSHPTRIRGARQLLTIGSSRPRAPGDGSGTPVVNPVELQVTTPQWRFLDGNVSWHIVREPNIRQRNSIPPMTDTTSFRFLSSEGPALLYQTFTASIVDPFTGAPIFYPTSLTAYTPPAIWQDWMPVAENLFSFNDVRFPWNAAQAWSSLDIVVPVEAGAQRVSFYALVLQTGGSGRVQPFYSNPLAQSAFLPPETQFQLTNFYDTSVSNPAPVTNYWRVGGSLVFEDADAGGEL